VNIASGFSENAFDSGQRAQSFAVFVGGQRQLEQLGEAGAFRYLSGHGIDSLLLEGGAFPKIDGAGFARSRAV